ncbi:hypothetical protein N7495_004037 [Penicillium taxi]|uniref:uncharacterized protein n=1 Tax=Penicillium taxi TaxID=168475 RepID=UPI002545320E|nr:uncharacterized protein N7495_004037 [Penicillium taxi]KAJ5899293.1 hypothetical protein N7495_004037 [Penicillium taxi]
MTINHVFVWGTSANFVALRSFYQTILQPLHYSEMLRGSDQLVGYGSDYPYFWLKQLPEGKTTMPTHIAFDAPNREAVDKFYEVGLQNGGRGNGAPGIRKEMSRQPYYAAFLLDVDGNNIEAVYVLK